MRVLSKWNDRSIDGMFVFWNPCARAELHQRKRARKLCSATLSERRLRPDFCTTWPTWNNRKVTLNQPLRVVSKTRNGITRNFVYTYAYAYVAGVFTCFMLMLCLCASENQHLQIHVLQIQSSPHLYKFNPVHVLQYAIWYIKDFPYPVGKFTDTCTSLPLRNSDSAFS